MKIESLNGHKVREEVLLNGDVIYWETDQDYDIYMATSPMAGSFIPVPRRKDNLWVFAEATWLLFMVLAVLSLFDWARRSQAESRRVPNWRTGPGES